MDKINLNKYGYIRSGVAVPTLRVGDPDFNASEIAKLVIRACSNQVDVLVFPELSLTGYTCADLFNQKILRKEAERSLDKLLSDTSEYDIVVAVGMPIEADNQLFNIAVVFHKGRILGVVPKTYLPTYGEFYEARWYKSSTSRISSSVHLCGQEVPFHENLLFKDSNSDLCIGVELCEDLWMAIPPSSYHALYGANLILNLSASNEIVGKKEYRRQLVSQQSARCLAGYLYSSAGQTESTTDLVFGGHSMIAENGSIVAETRFEEESAFIMSDIDIEKLMNDRIKQNSFMGNVAKIEYITVPLSLQSKTVDTILHYTDAFPFVPRGTEKRNERCRDIFQIQSTGLLQRIHKSEIQRAVLGISGGLDSTLALLVTVEAFKRLKRPMSDIIGVTMPGFGTTDRTYHNALTLMKELGITVREVPIRDAVTVHFKDIGHDMNVHDITYENSQARERTQILMDIANKEHGMVIGTGDLSELALGWCTYNGDHMSMYAVNASIPKTLVKYLVSWYSEMTDNEDARKALNDIVDTPVSPELLPPDQSGRIQQVTEDIVGPYELHDFFLYHMIRCGYTPDKIRLLANIAFKERYPEEVIFHWLKLFYKRFFRQQFKRSCLPDGPKVGSICLSPRGDWRMPSDACVDIWLKNLENDAK
jgi:NAD+ synthase (glutamine-hydrolysing)